MTLTVVIPTAGRAHLLRDALASIARQTALRRVSCIHVSENAGYPESEMVCREFPELPIHYTLRAPPLTSAAHFVALFKEVETPFTAMLHDDDWWAPHHLEAAMAGLENDASSSACYSGFFEPHGSSAPLYCENNLMCWAAAGFPPLAGTWTLPLIQTALASLPGTPLRYSTLVARSAALKASTHIFDLGNPFDSDRMLGIALSLHGNVVYQPVPSTFIRLHSGQDARNYDDAATYRHMHCTTRWMLDLVRRQGGDMQTLLAERIATCPPIQKAELLQRLRRPVCIDGLREENCIPPELDRFDRTWRRLRVGRVLRDWLPPAITNLARRLAHKQS